MRVLKVVVVLLILIPFLMGAACFGYPYIQGAIADHRIQNEVDIFFDRLEPQPSEPMEEPAEESIPMEYSDLWDAMNDYNSSLWTEKQSDLCDPWAYQQPSFTLGDFGLEDEVFAVLSIPKLELEMPIFLGATYQHMADGAAHLSQTSLPIGGDNTNCVIAGHRGWGGAAYFRYVPDLLPGDTVYITNLWEQLTYTVTRTKIIDPNDVEDILIQEGRDMITLLTCHPYASGGRQRFLVYCERSQ